MSKSTKPNPPIQSCRFLLALAVCAPLVGCAEMPEVASESSELMSKNFLPDYSFGIDSIDEPIDEPIGSMTHSVLSSGAGWRQMSFSGPAFDLEAHQTLQQNNTELFVMKGRGGVSAAPMSPELRARISEAIDEDLASEGAEDMFAGVLDDVEESLFLVNENIYMSSEEYYQDAGLATSFSLGGIIGSCSSSTYEKTLGEGAQFDKAASYTKSNSNDDFSGLFKASASVRGGITARVVLKVRRAEVLGKCVPYFATVRGIVIEASARAEAKYDIDGTTTAAYSFRDTVDTIPLDSLDFSVGPVPVHIGLDMPVEMGMDTSGPMDASLSGTLFVDGVFAILCTLSGCDDNRSLNRGFETDKLELRQQGQVSIEPWMQASLRAYLYHEDFASVQLGLRSTLIGDFWRYDGTGCGDHNGNGIDETMANTTFDADVALDLLAEISVFGSVVAGESWPLETWHVLFDNIDDLQNKLGPIFFHDTSGDNEVYAGTDEDAGSTSLDLTAGSGYRFRGQFRPCWPYADPIDWRVDWGDSTSVEYTAAPQVLAYLSHDFLKGHTYYPKITALRDAHGRDLKLSRKRKLEVPGYSWGFSTPILESSPSF